MPDMPACRRRAEHWHAAVLPPDAPNAGPDTSLPTTERRDTSSSVQLFVTALLSSSNDERQCSSRLHEVCSRAQPLAFVLQTTPLAFAAW